MSEEDELWSYPYEGVRCHRHMSRQARAAQFAPFAALTGYDEAIRAASPLATEGTQESDRTQQKLNPKTK
ncbi:MAG TPA: hypothetical protein DCP59_00420 [Megasphaera sp.]|nr:hypothetical protein [Megasphaera sp.]